VLSSKYEQQTAPVPDSRVESGGDNLAGAVESVVKGSATGWRVTRKGDEAYLRRCGHIFDGLNSTRMVAIFAPLAVVRMLVVGCSTSMLVVRDGSGITDDSSTRTEMYQAGAVLGINALQLVLVLLLRPGQTKPVLDSVVAIVGMATDLIPLLVAILPVEKLPIDSCGIPTVQAQLVLLAVALLHIALQCAILITGMANSLFRVLGVVLVCLGMARPSTDVGSEAAWPHWQLPSTKNRVQEHADWVQEPGDRSSRPPPSLAAMDTSVNDTPLGPLELDKTLEDLCMVDPVVLEPGYGEHISPIGQLDERRIFAV
jgi:hypothetical protein